MEEKFNKLRNKFALVCLLRSDMAPNFDYKYSYGYAKSKPRISVFSIARFDNTLELGQKIRQRLS